MSAGDAKKIVSPGYRPGNTRSIKVMARNLGHMESSPTSVIRYKDGRAIPFDGNHRATARIVRGDKNIPVKVIEGGERPAVSVARNAFHVGQQRVHRARMERGDFTPQANAKKTAYTGKHAGEGKVYSSIANGSPARSGRRVALESTRFAAGPGKVALHTKQAATVGAGLALLGGAHHLSQNRKVEKRDRNLSQTQIDRKKKAGANLTRTTSALGLGSVAALGVASAAPKLARSGKLARVIPKATEANANLIRQRTKSHLITVGVVSSGIGGYNGFNNASWQSAEARQRKIKSQVAKSASGSVGEGFYGESFDRTEVNVTDLHSPTD